MAVIGWMERNVPGFGGLSREEREAPMHFSLLWSYFEGNRLQTNASSEAIALLLSRLDQQGRLDYGAFAAVLAYFRDRYYRGGQLTHHFHSLKLRSKDRPQQVADVLSGANRTPIDEVTAVFIIIYRFRNNYFHGEKWSYQLRDQFDNFDLSCEALMRLMEM